MAKVKQWATEIAQNAVGSVINDYLKNKINSEDAKTKILKIENVNLAEVDENNVDDILSKYVINEISFKDAKSKIMKLDNLNLVNIDEDNIDEVLILEKEDYYKKLNKEGRSQ